MLNIYSILPNIAFSTWLESLQLPLQAPVLVSLLLQQGTVNTVV